MATKLLPETAALLEDALLNMPFRERLALLMNAGVPAESILGLEHCSEHKKARELARNASLSFDGSTMWCKGCWHWWTFS